MNAKFQGLCDVCAKPIAVGTPIERDRDFGWIHQWCLNKLIAIPDLREIVKGQIALRRDDDDDFDYRDDEFDGPDPIDHEDLW